MWYSKIENKRKKGCSQGMRRTEPYEERQLKLPVQELMSKKQEKKVLISKMKDAFKANVRAEKS